MVVYVKGMKMPDNCMECPIIAQDDDGQYCPFTKVTALNIGIQANCPLVEVPEKHGRLVDENGVIDAIHERLKELQTHPEFKKKHSDIDLIGVMPYIAKIKTVIEAED